MIFREALITDIAPMHKVRTAVTENPLPDPGMITPAEYEDFIMRRGKGWLCEIDRQAVGFSIADLVDNNVWALFVQPGFEKRGIGKELQRLMLEWYFSKTNNTIWLGTAPNSRAELFYRKSGWKETGRRANGEIRFEMSATDWQQNEVHTETMIRKAYIFFNKRDIDNTLAVMHADVEWPNGMEGGIEHGHDAVRKYWTRQWSMIDPHVEPIKFEKQPDGTVNTTVHQVIRDLSGNLLMDRVVQHIYTVKDGLISKMEIMEN
jgi:GNAT superfamily N-acetyltransferase